MAQKEKMATMVMIIMKMRRPKKKRAEKVTKAARPVMMMIKWNFHSLRREFDDDGDGGERATGPRHKSQVTSLTWGRCW